jgi:UDPglucose 6-dehydrogenase
MRQLAVIGTGYVGLVTGAMFASVGNRVACVDKNPRIVEQLRAGRTTIHEPGLEEILEACIAEGTLRFTTETAEAVTGADATFIAVGTPSLENGAYDFQFIHAAAHEVARALHTSKRHFVVLKSTVTPDVYDEIKRILAAESDADVEVISNPEFLAEGTAVRDFSQPHRIIVGIESAAARSFMEKLYSPFTKRKPGLLHVTDPKSAIVTKLAANSFLACRVALVNELARYCDAVGADIEYVRTGLASDPRIGGLFLYPGPGYGGSCFGKDIRALRESAREHGVELSLVPAIEVSNARHKRHVADLVERYHGSVAGKTIAVWGLAFKARTDDVRESPALDVIEHLLARGATIRAHDPQAGARALELFGDKITVHQNKYEALAGASALVIMTEWDAYKSPDFAELRERLAGALIIDARNILDPADVRQAGLMYVGMGRPADTTAKLQASTN